MSMIGCYRRVTPTELRLLQSNPGSIAEFLYPEEEQRAIGEALQNNQPIPKSKNFDVDKAWQAIQFLLCGDAWEGQPPLGNAVLGGNDLGNVDLEYGARYLTPDDVRLTAQALEVLPVERLMERFDYEALVQCGASWLPDDADMEERKSREEGERDYILFHYTALRRYFLEAAQAGDAMLLWIS